jgi:hypothetical protein
MQKPTFLNCPPRFFTQVILALGLLAVQFIFASPANAIAVAARMEKTTVSTSPLVRISHGWSGGEIYDVALELQAFCATKPVRLLYPTVQLAEDTATSSPAPAFADVTTAAMWVTYDYQEETRYPVHLLKRELEVTSTTARNANGGPLHPPQWTNCLDIMPGEKVRFTARFRLPRMELDRRKRPKQAPKAFTFTIQRMDVGCTETLTIKQTFPLNNRDLLMRSGPGAT